MSVLKCNKKPRWYAIPLGNVRVRWGHECLHDKRTKTLSLDLAHLVDGVSHPWCAKCNSHYDMFIRAEVYQRGSFSKRNKK